MGGGWRIKPATHLAILYVDRQKSPGVPGAAIAIFAINFAGIRQVCPFPRFSTLIVCESPAKSTNQVGRFSHMTFQNAPRWSPGTRLKCHIVAIGEKKSPGGVRINRWRKCWRSNSPLSAYKTTRCVAGLNRS